MLITAENIMGVYRNFNTLTKFKKTLVVIRVVFEVFVYVFVFKINVDAFRSFTFTCTVVPPTIMGLFYMCNFISGFIIMICGVQSSHSFKIFITDVRTVHHCFKGESTHYDKYVKKLKTVLITATALHMCGSIVMFATKTLNKIYLEATGLTLNYVLFVTLEIYVEIRHILENIVLYTYITMLHHFLKTVNDCILDILKKDDEPVKILYANRRQRIDLISMNEALDDCAMKYRYLISCSKKLSACFSSQVN